LRNISEFLARLDKVKSLGNGKFQALCPNHADTKPSLSITQSKDRILIHCLAGCSPEAIVSKLGLTMADLFIKQETAPAKIIDEYNYTDEDGKLLFQVVRYEPKSFKQRHKDNNGNWVWNISGVRSVIYHLPIVLKATNTTIYWVEGEKDVEALFHLGLVATTSPGGTGNWKPALADYLIGKRITIIPDNDNAGYEYAKQVYMALKDKAKELKCILLEAKDISDWLEKGGDIKTLPSLEQDASVLLKPSQVEITETITGFKFHWLKEKLVINISRVHSHTDGRITGDVQLIFEATNHQEPSFNFNFSSSQTRKQLSKSFNEKYPEQQWQGIIDELCRQVQRLTLIGEPIKELWTHEDIHPPEYLLKPILLKGVPTAIFGEKGVTKSNLALIFYIILTLPWHDNPLELGAPDHSVKTVILDWELPGHIAQWNLKKLQKGLELPPLALYHRRCHAPLADDVEAIQKYLSEMEIEVAIIDSLGRAVGGELLKDTENINRFFTALDKLKVTSLLLAQTSKESDAKGKRKHIYGSTFLEYYMRSIWELCKAESIGDDEISVALFHRSSNLTKLQKPMGFHFNFNEDKTTISREAVNYPEFLEKVNRQFQIMELLKIKPSTTTEIMEALEIKRSNADVILKKLKDKRKIIKLDDGHWGLRIETLF